MTAIAIFGLATTTIAQVPSYVPTNGLAGWWPFNGNANDESGNGNNGTVNGATLTADRFGNLNQSYGFDGVDDYLVTQNSGPLGNSNRSISIWFNSVNSNVSQIFGYGYQPPSGGEFNLLLNQLCAGITIDVHNNYITYNTINLTDGNWHNVVCVYNNTVSANILGVSFFVDGILLSNSSCQNPITVNVNTLNTSLNFGRYQAGALYFNGSLDDIGIWNRALTQQEITDLYNGCQLSVNTQPSNQTIDVNNNAQFVVGSSDPNATYQWQTDLGVSFQNLNSVGQYSGTTNDTLTVSNVTLSNNNQPFRCIISSGSCIDTSDVAVLTVNNNVGINEFSEDNLFTVFPNPAQSIINVKADSKLIGEVYSIYDKAGRIVLTGKLNTQNTTIELGNLSGGVYMLSVGENMKQTFKVIKE
jgi:hypothetical protein